MGVLLGHKYASGAFTRFENKYYENDDVEKYRNQIGNVNFYYGMYVPHGNHPPSIYVPDRIKGVPKSGELIIDLDFHELGQRERVFFEVLEVYHELLNLEANPVIYFSGQGFHLHVGSQLVHVSLPLICKVFVQLVVPHPDVLIYHSAGLIRFPNSINRITKTFKVVVDVGDVQKGYDHVIQLGKDPCSITQSQPSKYFDQVLLDHYSDTAQRKSHLVSSEPPETKDNDRIVEKHKRILESGKIRIGTRHRTTFLLALNLKHAGYNQEDTFSILIHWAKRIFDNQCSSSSWDDIAVDTIGIVDDIYTQDTEWIDWDTSVNQLYRKYVSRFKNQKRWTDKQGPMKLYALMKAMADLSYDKHGRFYLAQSVIREYIGSISSNRVSYIDYLKENGYIEKVICFPEN